MTKSRKFHSIGLLVIFISVLFVNGFIQVNINSLLIGSTAGSNKEYPPTTLGSNDMNYTVYGPPTKLTVTKSETVSIEILPNGSIKSQRLTVNFVFENDADENCSFDLIDRAESCDLDSIKFQKGTFPEVLEYEVLSDDEDHGIVILKWSNISVKARSRAEYGYSIASYKPIPLEVETEYYVNGSQIEINPEVNAFNASIGTQVSNIIRIRNIQQDYFSTSEAAKPTNIALVTLMLPFEEEEEDRDFEEPIFDPAPIMSNVLATIQQVSWLALGDEYEINWSTTIKKGGGWGIIELQPLRIDVIQSSSIMGMLADGLSALLSILAAQQAYWAGLTLMAMLEELTSMVGTLQVLLSEIEVQLGLLHMMNYSVLNSLLMALIEIDMVRTSVQDMYEEINATYYEDVLTEFYTDPLYTGSDVRSLFRTILGINEGVFLEGSFSNSGTGTPFMSLPLMLDFYSDIERRIVASVGAQIIEILGSPAIINMTSTDPEGFDIYINATLFRNPDNTTDFYTLIQIVNLSMPIEVIGLEIYSMNLSRSYEFRYNDVPGDRALFSALDEYFGRPIILSSIFPPDYRAPGSPESNFPGFYTWILDMLNIGRSAIWWMIGNMTQSIATLLLLLDSSFSEETIGLLNSLLSEDPSVDLTTPITLETGFQGVNDLMGMFAELQKQFESPFGSQFSDLIPDMTSFSMPMGTEEMELLNQFGFWTALKLYLEPVPRARQLLNITIPLDFGNMTGGMDTSSMMGGMDMSGFGGGSNAGTIENGQMDDFNWSYQGLTTASLSQTNTIENSTDFKRLQFDATGDVTNGFIQLDRNLAYNLPVQQITYRFRTDDINPKLSVVVVSQNASGTEQFAIQEHEFTSFSPNTWYDLTYDVRSNQYWESYDPTFDPENVTRVELRITPMILSTPVNIDIDYINLTRSVVPYPYDMTILDGYLVGDGIEIFPNTTISEKWTTNLYITDVQIEDMNGDSVNDVIASSNDGYLYLLSGLSGAQIWNYSAGGSIETIHLEDITGDPTPEIFIGTSKGQVYILDKNNNLLNNFSIGTSLDFLLYANLTESGSNELIVGQDNSVSIYDNTGVRLWNTTLKGNIRVLTAADLNGDGFDEVIAATSKYKIYTLNGTSGGIIWDYITEEMPFYLNAGNFYGDNQTEIIYGTDAEYCIILDGIQGINLLNFTADSPIWGIYRANLSGDGYDDILLHTGQLIGHNLSAISTGSTFDLLWNFTATIPFASISTFDCNPTQGYDEVLISTYNNTHYLVDSAGSLQTNFSTAKGISQVEIAEITQEGELEFIFGLSNNFVQVLNGSDFQQYWRTQVAEDLIVFQFIRTNNSLSLIYNLPLPITEILDTLGPSVGGIGDLTQLLSSDLSFGSDSGDYGGGISLGGLGSIGGTGGGTGGLDLGSMNLTMDNLPIRGLGLINMLEFEITMIAQLQDMKQVASTQRAFGGVHEVRYTDKDTIDYRLYPLITDNTNARYIQYKLRNYEVEPITLRYFALNMTYNGQPLSEDILTIEGWNGSHFVDLQNNIIYNITIPQLGLNYSDGILLFKPYLEIQELEKPLITIDWLERDLRIKIDTTSMDLANLSIEPWVDLSIELPGITTPGVSSVISYSKTIPTFIVTATPTPNITDDAAGRPFLELLVKSPAFWALSTTMLVAVFGFGYMKKREEKEVRTIASKKIINWLKKRENSWQTLVNADIMTQGQYYELKRIRYRIRKENLTSNHVETAWGKILKIKLIGEFISTALLMRFWRGVAKKSRLIWILNTLEHMVLDPLKHAWATFKTMLGYLNPWDMDRQRKRELQKKAANKKYWKKIEPPRKPIRKKQIEIIPDVPSTELGIDEKIKLKVEKTKKKKSKKKGKQKGTQYMTDGGTILKKINKAKRLPPITSRDGMVFYTLSKRKYVGMTLKNLSKELELPEYEVLVSLVRLLEKGLIFLLQEGSIVSEDIWDVTSSLRKYDSELEKLIESVETLDDEISEGMEYLKTEIETENNANDI